MTVELRKNRARGAYRLLSDSRSPQALFACV